MVLRALKPLLVLLVGSAVTVACGGPSGNDFGNGDASAGEPSNGGGTAGSSQGGSTQGGSSQGGSSGSGGNNQGGSAQGGSTEGGTASGGVSGTTTGGATTGGTAGTDPNGGTGDVGGTGQGGSSGASNGGQGGTDCEAAIQSAQAALSAAQTCIPATDGPRCTGSVEDLCGCTVPVDNPQSEATMNYLELREPAVKCGVPCLAIVCREPTTATCGFGGATTNIVARASCEWLPR